MQNKDYKFIEEHILDRKPFDEYLKEETIQEQAQKAFYSVWANWIFINPTTKNLRNVTEDDYATIKKLSYGTKNRLQSYIAFHLKKDHYHMDFKTFSVEESFTTIKLCEEIFDDTKILVDWWRASVSVDNRMTGEEWFQKCKVKFMHRKQINKIGFVFIDLNTNKFLKMVEGEAVLISEQDDATRFNLIHNDLIVDQEIPQTKDILNSKVKTLTNLNNLKIFIKAKDGDTEYFVFDISK